MDPRRRQRHLTWVAATTFALVTGSLAIGAVRHGLGSCERQEHSQIEAMQRRVDSELGKLQHRFEQYSACEETGRPGAVLYVEVQGWSSRRLINEQFRARGWVSGDGALQSAGGRYHLRTIESYEADGVDRHLYAAISPVARAG
jgi:hypothetical protein